MLSREEEYTTSTIEKNTHRQFIPVPLCFQETPYTCGVACVQSILACYGIIYRQDVLSELLMQKPLYGTDYQNIINFMEMLGFYAAYHIEMNIETLKSLIDIKITPLLLLQAWKDDPVDYTYDWRDSHYVVACGYEEDRILFMDPWTLANYTYIPDNELMKRWHTVDQAGNHNYYTGLVIKNDNLPMLYNPSNIKRLD